MNEEDYLKGLIEKAFAVGHTIGYGNNENHYKPEFERWWNDENTQEQVKKYSIPDVSGSFSVDQMHQAYIDGYNEGFPEPCFDINNYR